jgi:hypothetical protein
MGLFDGEDKIRKEINDSDERSLRKMKDDDDGISRRIKDSDERVFKKVNSDSFDWE